MKAVMRGTNATRRASSNEMKLGDMMPGMVTPIPGESGGFADPSDPVQRALLTIPGRRRLTPMQAVLKIQKWYRRIWKGHGLANDAAVDLLKSARVYREGKNKIRHQLREICIYVIFLLMFTASSIMVVQDQRIFHMSHKVEVQFTETEFLPAHAHVLKTFDDIETLEELQQWMLGPMHRTLYDLDRNRTGTIFGVDHIIGGIRISQLRVQPSACATWHGLQFNDAANEGRCFGDASDKGAFTEAMEDRNTFGSNGVTFEWAGNHGTLHKGVQEERDAFGSGNGYRSRFANVYPPGAFPVILPRGDGDAARDILKEVVIKGEYVDLQTRAVMVELTLFNPQMDYWSHISIIAESMASGGIATTFAIDTVRLYSLVETSSGNLTWILEVIVVAFYVYYWVLEVLVIKKEGFFSYFSHVGNVMHNANLIMFLFMWVFRFLSIMALPTSEEVKVDSDTFYTFHVGASLKVVSVLANSFNAFLCWFKLVRYLAYIPRFALVTGTFSKASSGISGFIIVFCLVMYGFSAAHLLAFGSRLSAYRNMTQSGFSLLTALLGDFDFESLQESQFFMGPLLFIVFISVAVFVVLNILIAIISDAYAAQRAVLMNTDDVELGQEMKDYIMHVTYKIPVIGPILRRANAQRRRLMQEMMKVGQSVRHKGGRSVSGRWRWARSGSMIGTLHHKFSRGHSGDSSPVTTRRDFELDMAQLAQQRQTYSNTHNGLKPFQSQSLHQSLSFHHGNTNEDSSRRGSWPPGATSPPVSNASMMAALAPVQENRSPSWVGPAGSSRQSAASNASKKSVE